MDNKPNKILSIPSDHDLVLQAHNEISRCAVELLRNEPFFGHILGGLQRHFTKNIPTLAVGLRGDSIQLIINPDFLLNKLKRFDQRIAVLKHELLHIVFKHLFRNQSISHDPILWNLASDLVVNQYIAPYHLPDGAILLTTFPDLELNAEETADYYYSELIKLRKKLENKGRGKNKSPQSARALKDLLDGALPSFHGLWADRGGPDLDGEKTGYNIPEMVREAIKQVSEDQIVKIFERTKASRIPGRIPAWLDRYISDIIESKKARVSWRRTLKMFAASSRRSQIINTLQRESRRFDTQEGMPPIPGLKLKRVSKLAVVIDTSGSIDKDTIAQFFAEIHEIYKNGAEITIVECDADIKKYYSYRGKIPDFVSGGGGTSFEPVMIWLNEKNRRYDGCIYLTDGYADAPETKPKCRLLWVVVGGEGGDHLRYGKQVVID